MRNFRCLLLRFFFFVQTFISPILSRFIRLEGSEALFQVHNNSLVIITFMLLAGDVGERDRVMLVKKIKAEALARLIPVALG